ncbi:BREX-1 system adenine-specific DNA-methyltransferase PglX [Pseudomonas aeruginosa]|uniref:BREX-1 system adenine-specific DNA-methyltransferase PglX n=1 Tax=Pseudomonas aeruginosa TaxID=287 RepID=UPI0032E4DE11
MNRSALKKYAPQARLDFIEAVTLRARRLGLDPQMPVGVEQTGDVLLVGGQPFPASIARQRTALAQRIRQQGFDAVMEALAYTWFNRLVAIRFMELKGYLSHGFRVLSHPEGLQQPEILEHVQHLELPGLDREEAIRLKTAGNQDEVLYREILLAQCHELHRYMPFLFEALDDATELLLPDNLLRTDSLIAHLVGDIEEDDWLEVEIIGWLYQFYISEKKDQVIGKVVKSEDIPAATQLFTPNWIVQYLVQNSLGRLWLMANPGSNLKEKMPYYIEPAEQTPEVQAQLDALIKVRMDEDGGSLNPESLTVLDPACGSGHILVEAYNLLRAIYEERGYRLRDIPRLILQKNLYGLDIDDRAAQLAGFALLMKAREDDRRLFDEESNPPHLNVMAIQQSAGLPDEEMAQVILNAAIQIEGGEEFHSGQLFGGGQLGTQHSSGLTVLDLRQLIQLFEYGKTFGSLISVPESLKVKLSKIVDLLDSVRRQGDELSHSYASQVLEQFAWPASLLAMQYDAIVANPPYMGGRVMFPRLKRLVEVGYSASSGDLYSAFLSRFLVSTRSSGFLSFIVLHTLIYLSSFEEVRRSILQCKTISGLLHIGYNTFPELNSKIAQGVAISIMGGKLDGFIGRYVGLNHLPQSADKRAGFLEEKSVYEKNQAEFLRIPYAPLAYWVSHRLVEVFERSSNIESLGPVRQGFQTGDNDKYLRYWFEVAVEGVNFNASNRDDFFESQKKWAPYNKGGSFRKWYGNNEFLVRFDKAAYEALSKQGNCLPSRDLYFKEGVTWSALTSADFGARYSPPGFTFSAKGACAFPVPSEINFVLGLLNSKVSSEILKIFSGTLDFNVGSIREIPVLGDTDLKVSVSGRVDEAVSLAKSEWDSNEVSWGFAVNPLVGQDKSLQKLGDVFLKWSERRKREKLSLQKIELEIDCLFLQAYGLKGEIDAPEIHKEFSEKLEEVVSVQFLSYALGCMMGRYSLDQLGLIYANSGNVDFEPSRYRKFPADSDGIIPITDEAWFEDDAAERVREFIEVIWGADTLVENMEWLADSLGRKTGESADEAIRRYLSTSFYKDHLQTYKKRPIYWLFSSGKQKAFECLVYLHRYNEGTLSRMRMEYVVPLQSRMQARIDKLSDDIDSATSSAQQKALQKRKDKLTKQLEELRRFDEALRPYADQRISLDLDDGVKVNYGKFGNLLAEVKAITGGKDD